MEKIDSFRDDRELLGLMLDHFMDDTYLDLPMELFNIESFDPVIRFSSNHDYQHSSACQEILKDMIKGGVENEGDESSETTAATTTRGKSKRKKDGRSRTLVSERKRRDSMKELLYLRSMVPHITKMDKASITADAVVYIQDLQNKAKKLRAEIASLGSSFSESNEGEGESNHSPLEMEVTIKPSTIKKILQVEEFEIDLSLPTLKLWIAQAFLNQGFEFVTLQPSA